MKEDKLKEFIDQHKEDFESEFPSEGLWDRIENELDQKETKVFSIQRFLPYTAAAAMIVLSLFFFFNKGEENIAEKEIIEVQDNLVSDFGEVESYYTMQVNDKMRDLSQYDVDPELMAEIADLKTEFDELKVEMGYGADPVFILEAMIENYRLRLEILEDLLEAFDETKEEKHEIIQ